MFYSKSTGGFYDREIHGDNIPADAVEITVEQHVDLINGQSLGKQIAADVNGFPILQDLPPLTVEQMAVPIREKRDYLLSASDWVVTKAAESGSEVSAEWKAYRQALRDLPTQAGFPASVTWPVMP